MKYVAQNISIHVVHVRDHVVISGTLPHMVNHGHFVNPPSPLADHVVYGWPLMVMMNIWDRGLSY